MILAIALKTVLVTWLQSNHVVGKPQALYGQTDAIRCVGLALVLGAAAGGVVIAAIIAAFRLPIILAWRTIDQVKPEPSQFPFHDMRDGFSFLIMRVAVLGFPHADILILGVFASPEVVAPYVIASRFAMML